MRFLAPLVALLMFLWSHAALAAPLWRLSEVAGPVRLQKGNLVRPAARGATLAPGEGVVTGPGGRAVLVRGEEIVVVFPGSRLRVPEEAEQANGIIQMIQDLGDAIYKIQKKATPHFGVKTPYLAAVVKGTTFKVSSDAQGAKVRVMEGRVEVATNDGRERRMVVPGHVAKVAKDKPEQMVEGVDTEEGDERASGNGDKADKTKKDKSSAGSAAADNRNERSLDNPSSENRSDKADKNRSSDKSNNGNHYGHDNAMMGAPGMGGGFKGANPNATADLKRTVDIAKKANEQKVENETNPDRAPKAPKGPEAPKAPKAPEAPKAPKAPEAPKAPKAMLPEPATIMIGKTSAALPPAPPPAPTGFGGRAPSIAPER